MLSVNPGHRVRVTPCSISLFMFFLSFMNENNTMIWHYNMKKRINKLQWTFIVFLVRTYVGTIIAHLSRKEFVIYFDNLSNSRVMVLQYQFLYLVQFSDIGYSNFRTACSKLQKCIVFFQSHVFKKRKHWLHCLDIKRHTGTQNRVEC